MKKLGYTVEVQVGHCVWSKEYNVVAPNADKAIKKAVAQAKKDTGRKTGWRCTKLTECDNWVLV